MLLVLDQQDQRMLLLDQLLMKGKRLAEVYNQSFNNWAQPLSGEPVFGLSGDNGPSPYSVRSVLKGDFSRKHVLFVEGVRVMVHFK